MKIIKQGIPPAEWIYVGECKFCGTIAEATRDELDPGQDTEPEEGDELGDCKCPVCEDENMVFKFKSKGEPKRQITLPSCTCTACNGLGDQCQVCAGTGIDIQTLEP